MTPAVFVVDTNIVVAGLITSSDDSPVAVLLDAMLSGSLVYLLSPELLSEYRSVLLRPAIRELHGLAEPEIDRLLVELTANAMWREISGHLWALLAAQKGSVLVTGDQLLLDNPPTEGSVMSARRWMEIYR